MHIGIAADHAGYTVKEQVLLDLKASGHEIVDHGAHRLDLDDDYPDFVAPLVRAVATGDVHRGIAIFGSSIGA